ncbi:MAG: SDR family NAD(P)-dependent oxidoreductase [Gammaproteobacteria bacterium]|nr:MAG: SDR family NAD(P)-dependent oxidoreductase [Gammaproteobacteria bacterium]
MTEARTILITGATDGIGLETARRLASEGHRVMLHGRNADKLKAAVEVVSQASGHAAEGFLADLSDMRQVVRLADEVIARVPKLDVLINNAGIFKTPETRTADGLDVRFAVNTLAPWLLTERLLALLGREGRVVNVASAAQAPVDLEALAGRHRSADDFNAYAQSKLALIMWTRDFTASHPQGPMMVAVNPGSLLASKMVKEGFGVPGKDIGIGADILVRAALSDAFAQASGRYFDNDSGRFAEPHPDALSGARCRAVTEAIEMAVMARLNRNGL